MRWAGVVGFVGVCLLLVVGGAAATFAPTMAHARSRIGVEAVLPANASTGASQSVFLTSVSCASAGNCSAVGSYLDSSGSTQGLLLTETAGRWASGAEAILPPGAALRNQNVSLSSVSCPSGGDCSAVGSYLDRSGSREGLLLTEKRGGWASGVAAVLPADAAKTNQSVSISSVSCASAGSCSAVGGYKNDSSGADGLLLTEIGGTWASGVEAALPANAASPQEAGLSAVSCASAGNCSAVGSYNDSSGAEGLLLSETAGTWGIGSEAALPGDAFTTQQGVDLTSISCPSAGSCSAVGTYTTDISDDAVLLTQTAGNWATGVKAALPANAASPDQVDLNAVSCRSVGNCAAVGGYVDRSRNIQLLLLTETVGLWSKGVQAILPANAATGSNQVASIDSVSCASTGNCSAVGHYTVSSDSGLVAIQGLLLTETAGTWATGVKAALPANAGYGAYLTSVSCPSAGDCAAVGGYGAMGAVQGLLLGGSATPTCLAPRLKGKTLTAAKRSIRAHHCSVGRISSASSRTVKRGHVLSQNPAPGTRLEPGAKINLVISRGKRS
jgi:PASTA domain